MATKKVKKSNHRVFAIAFSTLIIVALLLIVPISLMALNGNLDLRNYAKVGPTPTVPNQEFLYINTSPAANYLDTRWESPTFELEKDVTYALQTAFIPYNLVDGPQEGDADNGLHVAIVCAEADGKCAGKTPGSEINVNEFLAEIPVTKEDVAENKLGIYTFRNLRPFKMPADGTYRIHIFANNGTEVAINHVRVRPQSSTENKVPNGDFENKQDVMISRDYPDDWKERSIYSNEYVLRPANDLMIIRGRYSPGAAFPVETHPTVNNNFYTTFTTPATITNTYNLVAKAKMNKKRPGVNTPTARLVVSNYANPTSPQLVFSTLLPNNGTNTIDIPLPALLPSTNYTVEFESDKGTEWELDTLGIRNSNQPADVASSYITTNPFMKEWANYQAKTYQPANWTAAPANRNFSYSHLVKKDRGPIGDPFANGEPEAPPTAECLTEEVEPNSVRTEANSRPKLCENQQISGKFNTPQDSGEYARFDLYMLPNTQTGRSITVSVNNLMNVTDVSVWKFKIIDGNWAEIGEVAANAGNSDQNKTVTFEAQPDLRYHVQLKKVNGSSTEPYIIKWQYTN